MAYGLPNVGEPDWGQKVNNSVAAVKATADAAQPAATLDAAVTAVDNNAASSLRTQQDARLSATYAPKGIIEAETSVAGSGASGAQIHFRPTHEDGYCQVKFWPEQGAVNPDAIITVHKELSGTETLHRHMTFYTSTSAPDGVPVGRIDIEYGVAVAQVLFSASYLEFNTDAYVSGKNFRIRGNATNNAERFRLENSATGGHSWTLGEDFLAGVLTFRDSTSAVQPPLSMNGINGRVGIGVTFPSALLDVGGNWMVGTDGIPQWAIAGTAQTTVGAAGGAAALPATPTKYLKVKDAAGTTFVVPAYAAS